MSTKPGPVPRVYSYSRFSSKQQAKGDSLTRQAEARDRWLAANGLMLYDDAKFTDAGVSAFRGANQENPERNALAAFLELVGKPVEKGGVPRGSYLVVEALDRLTREHIRPALTLLLNLIDKGVKVVQLLPAVEVFDESVEPMKLMMAVMELQRGNSESLVKSDRVGKAWGRRKAAARSTRAVITRECPAWLEVIGGKYKVRDGAADAIKLVYRLAAEGQGLKVIVRRLVADKVVPLGGSGEWSKTTVSILLRSRRVAGEYQPMKGTGGTGSKGRKPDGPPIPNFYPAIITEDEWAAARLALEARRADRGPVGKTLFPFGGLLRDARDGAPIYRTDKGAKGGGAKLVNSRAMDGRGGEQGRYVSFPVSAFESEVLKRLKEVDPREVLPGGGGAKEVKSLETRRADVENRIARIQAQMVAGDEDVGPLVAVVRQLKADLDATGAKLAEVERQAATPTASAWQEYGNLYDVLRKAPDRREARARLRIVLRRIVSAVTCLFAGSGMTRLAVVQIDFRGGTRRHYLIRHRAAHGRSGTPAQTDSNSFKVPVAGAEDADLGNPKDVKLMERLLHDDEWVNETIAGTDR